MSFNRFWFLLQQDIDRPIGGVKQIFRLASIISDLGYSACIVQKTESFRPSWFDSADSLKAVSYSDFCQFEFNPSIDVIVLPETFLPIFFKLPQIPIIIFNQNIHYLHGEKMNFKPSFVSDVYSSERLLHTLTVSRSDFSYLLDLFPLSLSTVSLVVNAIELDLFRFNFSTSRIITYMPRKNSSHVRIVLSLLSQQSWFKNSQWKLVPINNMSQNDVARLLSSSSIFLSFGYPEGFGLPLAEALLSGCYVVGYDGIGGRELSGIGESSHVFNRIEFLDFHSFIMSVKYAISLYDEQAPTLLPGLISASEMISREYSPANMIASVKQFLGKINA